MAYFLLAMVIVSSNMSVVFQKKYRTDTMRLASSADIFLVINSLMGIVFYYAMAGFNVTLNTTVFIYSAVYALVCISSLLINLISFDLIDLVYRMLFSGAGGMIIPFVFELAVGMEQFSAMKTVAVFIRITAILLPLFFAKPTKTKKGGLIICIALFIEAGIGTLIPKLYAISPGASGDAVFCFWTNVFMAPIVVLFAAKKSGIKTISSDIRSVKAKSYMYIILNVAVGNAATLFMMAVLKTMTVTLYTIITSTFSMLFTVAASILLFKEKPSAASYAGAVLSVIAIILYAI